MIQTEKFNLNELKLCYWQYAVKHWTTDSFKVGEKVFYKIKPKCPLIVIGIDEEFVTCEGSFDGEENQIYKFAPHSVLQYELANLKVYLTASNMDRKTSISDN